MTRPEGPHAGYPSEHVRSDDEWLSRCIWRAVFFGCTAVSVGVPVALWWLT